jgi:hypothetical protein
MPASQARPKRISGVMGVSCAVQMDILGGLKGGKVGKIPIFQRLFKFCLVGVTDHLD